MYYIQPESNESGSYGNPITPGWSGALALPDELLSAYIDSMGFVTLTVKDGVVTSVKRNEEAYQAYVDSLPEPEPEPEPQPTPQDTTDALLIDHELRITMLELGL